MKQQFRIKRKKRKPSGHQNILRILSSRFIRIAILLLIFSTIISLISASIDEFSIYTEYFFRIAYFSSLVFALEYILRLISAPAKFKASSEFHARIKYVFSFYGMVDLIAILPFILIFFESGENIKESLNMYKILQVATLQCLFNIFKLIRYSTGFKAIARVFRSVKNELFAVFTTCGIVLLLASTLIFYLENTAQPDKFANLGDGLWWAIVTFTTIGYGDIVPITIMGRILGGVIGLAGILLIAIPTALISSAFFNMKRKESSNVKILDDKSKLPHEDGKEQRCPHCNKTLK